MPTIANAMTGWRWPRHKPQEALAFESHVEVAEHRLLESSDGLLRRVALRQQIKIYAFSDETRLAPIYKAPQFDVFAAMRTSQNRRGD